MISDPEMRLWAVKDTKETNRRRRNKERIVMDFSLMEDDVLKELIKQLQKRRAPRQKGCTLIILAL